MRNQPLKLTYKMFFISAHFCWIFFLLYPSFSLFFSFPLPSPVNKKKTIQQIMQLAGQQNSSEEWCLTLNKIRVFHILWSSPHFPYHLHGSLLWRTSSHHGNILKVLSTLNIITGKKIPLCIVILTLVFIFQFSSMFGNEGGPSAIMTTPIDCS